LMKTSKPKNVQAVPPLAAESAVGGKGDKGLPAKIRVENSSSWRKAKYGRKESEVNRTESEYFKCQEEGKGKGVKKERRGSNRTARGGRRGRSEEIRM